MLVPCMMVVPTMNAKQPSRPVSPVTRRHFLKTGAIVTAGLASLSRAARAQTNKNSKLRVFQIGVGGIGALQRKGLKDHPMVEWAGFCDVDKRELDKISKDFPNAWLLSDYREAFANKLEDFDAVIVDTPDFNHAAMMLTTGVRSDEIPAVVAESRSMMKNQSQNASAVPGITM